MSRLSLILVFTGMILGAILGLNISPESSIYGLVDLIGQLFMNALKLVIVPLVVSSIITGVAKMGEEEGVAALGLRSFGWFISLTTIATLVGLLVVVFLEPGLQQGLQGASAYKEPITCTIGSKLKEIALKFFPSNIFEAASQGQMLGLIVFSLIFGSLIPKIPQEYGKTLLSFWKGVFEVMMAMTRLFMKFLPLGVFALIAKVIASTGIEGIKSSGWFFGAMAVAYALYFFVVLSFFLITFAKVNPWTHMKAMGPALLTAFTTTSSAATLPVAIECLEDRAKIPNRIVGFTFPVGTSFHMAGTAIFECVAVIFIGQAFGVPMTAGDYVLITLLSILLSAGVAGIPSGCVVSAVVILTMLDMPLEGVALLFVVERFVDMMRTTVNVYSNSVCTRLIARA
ncbi:MAG: dicarboxylate/amino acid:cation symporter [Chlamydiia bacterium]|nr:dicarboxylate/amino acid:cation symporter [Chlamydiia bacterium]